MAELVLECAVNDC